MPVQSSLPGYTSSYQYGASTVPGVGAYGQIPNQIGIPPSRYQQATTTDPGLAGNTQAASSFLNSELLGQLSPASKQILQDKSASWGVGAGIPGSGLNQDAWDTSKVAATMGLQQHGLNDLGNYASWLGGLQTDPNLAATIASHNAQLAASPDPYMAYQQMRQDAGLNDSHWGSIIGGIIGGPFAGIGQNADSLANGGHSMGTTQGGGLIGLGQMAFGGGLGGGIGALSGSGGASSLLGGLGGGGGASSGSALSSAISNPSSAFSSYTPITGAWPAWSSMANPNDFNYSGPASGTIPWSR